MDRLQQLNDELSVELQSHELQKVNLSDQFRTDLAKKEVSLICLVSKMQKGKMVPYSINEHWT